MCKRGLYYDFRSNDLGLKLGHKENGKKLPNWECRVFVWCLVPHHGHGLKKIVVHTKERAWEWMKIIHSMHLWSPRNILPNFYFKIFGRFFLDSANLMAKAFCSTSLSLSLSLSKFNWPMQFYILDIFTRSVCLCANVANGKKSFFYALVCHQQTTLMH